MSTFSNAIKQTVLTSTADQNTGSTSALYEPAAGVLCAQFKYGWLTGNVNGATASFTMTVQKYNSSNATWSDFFTYGTYSATIDGSGFGNSDVVSAAGILDKGYALPFPGTSPSGSVGLILFPYMRVICALTTNLGMTARHHFHVLETKSANNGL